MAAVIWRLYVAWDMTNYIDESARLIEATGEMQLAPIEEAITGGRGIVDSMTLNLSNHDNRYSPLYTSSPLFSYLQNANAYHAPCYLEISIDSGSNYYRIFTGVIKLPKITSPTMQATGTVEIECRSRDELLLQRRLSTPQSDFVASAGYNERQIINLWLTQAGVSGSDMLLDAGLFSIAFAWMDDESVLEELWNVAAACGGRFYANPDGKFVYENAAHWLTSPRSTASQETLNEASYDTIVPAYADGELYDVVTVESSARYIAPRDVLWEPDEDVVVPANASKKVTARLRQAAWNIDSISYTAVTAGGTNINSSVSISSVQYAQRVELTITNSHATHAAYLRPLRITGQSIDGAPSAEESRNSTDHGSNAAFFASRGSRTKSVRAGVYVQSKAHAGAVANFLLRRYEIPRLNYSITNAVGNPQRRLGDRITLYDTRIANGAKDAILTSNRWSLSSGGFNQDLELMDAGQLYPYHPSPGYAVIGSDVMGSSKKVFF